MALTSDQVSIVEQAIAFVGYPPVNGPSGYPPSYRTTSTTPTSGSKPGKVTGLHTTTVTKSHIGLDWNGVSGAQGYHVQVNGHRQTSVVYSSYALDGLHPNTHYSIGIIPFNAKGEGPMATVHVTTHKK